MPSTADTARDSDREQLYDLLCRFQLAFDLRQWDTLESLLHPEIYVDYSSFRGTEPGMQPRAAYVAARAQALAQLSCQHNFSNLRLEIGDTRATGQCNYAIHRFDVRNGTTQDFFHSFGRYAFNFLRTEQGWKITGITQHLTANIGNPNLRGGGAAPARPR